MAVEAQQVSAKCRVKYGALCCDPGFVAHRGASTLLVLCLQQIP
jgi:hypothetical protein